MGLEELERQVRQELGYFVYPARPWVPETTDGDSKVLDVLIVGGGQAGLAIAFGLRLERVVNIEVVDAKPEGLEGPWVDFARMLTLRTPKHVTGPDLGFLSLTPQKWFEARFGAEAWETTKKIDREAWAQYLGWYRRILDLPVRNDSRVVAIRPHGRLLAAELSTGEIKLARRIVLATGIEGGGQWVLPDIITDALPKSRYAHTSEAIDFAQLRGRRIGILGGGASAFDNAAVALEHGAASVDLCIRRPDIPRINPYRWIENTGYLAHFADLPDLLRWRMTRWIFEMNQPPPQETVRRCCGFAEFRAHTGMPWHAVSLVDDEIRIGTPKRDFTVDFVIAGTGFVTDVAKRPELSEISADIAIWRDRFVPPPGEEHAAMSAHPYLAADFSFLPRLPGTAAHLSSIHDFTFSTMLSLGLTGGSISGMKYGVRRLVSGITRSLFVEDGEAHYASLRGYDEPELVDFQQSMVMADAAS